MNLIQEIFQVISDFEPTDLVAHTSPWDIEGITACHALEGLCNRYLSNITDHAFWLGTTAFDYFLEFRSFGCNISQKYRGIISERDILIPYFPIINKEIPFGGFPFDARGKQIIVSGGGIHKIKGSTKFLEIVKYILDRHPNALFLYLGHGDHHYLENFSSKYGYEGRFFHINERKDIYEIIRHCTLYLNTYPHLGALMTQIAAEAGKPPLTLNDKKEHNQKVSELLIIKKDTPKLEFDDIDELKQSIDNYLTNPFLLKEAEDKIRGCVPTPEMFALMMQNSLENHSTGLVPNTYSIDTTSFASDYIARFKGRPETYRYFFYDNDIRLAVKYFPYYVHIISAKIKSIIFNAFHKSRT